jgi:hypothetical protein
MVPRGTSVVRYPPTPGVCHCIRIPGLVAEPLLLLFESAASVRHEDVLRGTLRWLANRVARLPPRIETRWVVATCGYPASASAAASSKTFHVEPSHGSPTDYRGCYRELEPRLVVEGCGCPASASSTASSEMFRVEPSHDSPNRLPQLLPRTGPSVGCWGLWMSGKRLRSRVIEDVSRGTSRGLPRALVAMVADSNPA